VNAENASRAANDAAAQAQTQSMQNQPLNSWLPDTWGGVPITKNFSAPAAPVISTPVYNNYGGGAVTACATECCIVSTWLTKWTAARPMSYTSITLTDTSVPTKRAAADRVPTCSGISGNSITTAVFRSAGNVY
jgi:hypothetical protein